MIITNNKLNNFVAIFDRPFFKALNVIIIILLTITYTGHVSSAEIIKPLYSAPYFGPDGAPPGNTVAQALDKWWEFYKQHWSVEPYGWRQCSYSSGFYPSGELTGLFVWFSLEGDCSGGNKIRGTASCPPSGYDNISGNCIPNGGVIADKNKGGKLCTNISNPLNVATGNKYQQELDYIGNGYNSLRIERFYNSSDSTNGLFGSGWHHYYERSLVVGGMVLAKRPDGKVIYYVTDGVIWKADSDIHYSLKRLSDGWELHAPEGTIEKYNNSGNLLSINYINGTVETIGYNQNNRVNLITNDLGESLTITYNSKALIDTITLSDGRQYLYSYDSLQNLITVTYPDGTPSDNTDNDVRQYHYEDANFKNALTGITDERNVRFSTYIYDTQGRVVSSSHANNANKTTVIYNADGTRTVTNSLNNSSTYQTVISEGVALISSITGAGCSNCGNTNSSFTYDPNNNVLTKTKDGITTQYDDYDSNGNPGYMIEAFGTANARRTDYKYDPRFQSKVLTKSEPSVFVTGNKITTYTYDNLGNTTQIKVDGFTPAGTPVSRIIDLQYNGPLNQISQIDGPRIDVSDITSLTYYLNDATQGDNRGRLQQVVAANGILLRDNIQYTPTGKVASEQRPNSLSLSYSYYPGNDRLQTLIETSGGVSSTTRWTYLATGEVNTITRADGSTQATTLTLDYDAARRLTQITDDQGNIIQFTLDTEGNITQTDINDTNGILQNTLSQTFDVYNRLDISTLVDENTDYDFAADGTLSQVTNARNVTTQYTYDELKRLQTTTGDVNGTDTNTQNVLTTYGYDVNDNLTSVQSPNNTLTTYNYDDLGNLLSETSPDRGALSYSYNEAGQTASVTDARGITVNYSYDALGRTTIIDYPTNSEDVNLTYDTVPGCNNGSGKICQILDESGTTTYNYDGFGNTLSTTRVTATATYLTQYTYDLLDQTTSITYPGGRQISYTRDSLSQITAVDTTINALPVTVTSNALYRADGQITSFDYGNGHQESRAYNTKGRITSLQMPVDNGSSTPPPNQLPVAVAGNDQNANENASVTLNGSASTDPDGTIASYSWLQTAGPTVSLTGAQSVSASFTAPFVSTTAALTFSLTVTDDQGETASDSITITVNDVLPNQPPVANNGGPYTTTAGTALTIDGSGSTDPEGSPLSYQWYFGDGGTGSGVSPVHTYSNPGSYTIELRVNDGQLNSGWSIGTAIVNPPSGGGNNPPVANAGGPYSGVAGTAIAFNGSASSDPENDPLSYQWQFGDGGTATGVSPSYTYAAVGTYTVQLQVSDAQATSIASATATVTSGTVNTAPVANTGGPYTVTAGTALTLDGSGSTDAEGNALTYQWYFGDGTTGSGTTGSGVSPIHTYANPGSYTIWLRVNDGQLNSGWSLSTVTVTVSSSATEIKPFDTVTLIDKSLMIPFTLKDNNAYQMNTLVGSTSSLALQLAAWALQAPSQPNPALIQSEIWLYGHDSNGNVNNVNSTSQGNITYGYDVLDRLQQDNRPVTVTNYTYERNGNRTSDTDGTNSNSYTYTPNSNQLNAVNANSVTHDQVGNRKTDRNGTRVFNHNDANRLFQVVENGSVIATYTYNALGQRTRKVTPTKTIEYHYDLSGQLIAETDINGVTQREYLYMEQTPVAQIDSGVTENVYYLHTDHLETPRRATDSSAQVVWSWEGEAFGNTLADADPDYDGQQVIVNFRYPGQYYDSETGLHYNYFRYYDPATGRYITSDPIGLAGGLNTYGYVGGNPVNAIDPSGLVKWGDLAFGVIDCILSTSEAVLGLGVMIGSPATGPVAPGTFAGGLGIATHGLMGMANSGIAIKNALNETNDPGLLEGTGGALFGDTGAQVGQAADMFTGMRPGAIASGSVDSLRDLYDIANTTNTMKNTFCENKPQCSD